MDLKLLKDKVSALKDEAFAIAVYDGGKLTPQVADLDKILKGTIKKGIKSGTIKTSGGSVTILFSPAGKKFDLYILGLGKSKKLTVHGFRSHLSCAVMRMVGRGVGSATLLYDGPKDVAESMRYLRAACDTFLLRPYKFTGYFSNRKKEKEKKFRRLTVNLDNGNLLKKAKPLSSRWVREADGVWLSRDLSNTPANRLTPQDMASVARKMCRETGIKCKVLGKPEIEKLKMGSFLGVNAGSAKPPRLIVMDYSPRSAKKKTICIVGKGLTFDSGGISLKPWDGMWGMKGDMGGAASTIGILKAIAKIKPKHRVVGICPCTENMPDGNALKPGDVIQTMSGKSIEIHSTDAEGRLVLADALEYATKFYKPDVIIDLATLTGACVVALGNDIVGLFSDSDSLAEGILNAGEAANEAVWRMPMFEEYKKLLKSDVADQKNIGGRWAGAITAALFLREFTDVKNYAHLDIAGPSMADADKWHTPKGGAGAAVRLVVEYICNLK